jgi:bla regulator protein blaR1
MTNRSAPVMNVAKKIALGVAGLVAMVVPMVVGAFNAPAIRAQDAADWQTKAGGKMAFEVASVKLTKGEAGPPSFPVNVGEAYRPTGGYFKADFPLATYIEFAYKITPVAAVEHEMFAHLPRWITTESYSIQARAAGNPTKDHMRLMMQSLLAERFKLSAHFETRDEQVFALTLVKAGKPGPKLIPHADGLPCGDLVDPSSATAPARVLRGEVDSGPENFPPMCDSVALIRKPNGMLLLGYRNATMDMLAGSLSGAVGQGLPVIDRTGLSGRYDFTIEWKPTSNVPPPSDSPDAPAPTSLEALRDQLGLKAESTKAPVQILVIDRVERPSEN